MNLFAGRYVLVDPIRDGGMGSVWRAWDTRRQVYVAAKLLRPADAGSLLRFVREQSLRMDHPHVLTPQSWAADDDTVLLTMPLMRGGSLSDLLADYGALPPAFVAILMDQLFDGLAAVHAHGVVHRDVKPANLLLEPTGRGRPHLRLADFGIAAIMGEPRLTTTTATPGTAGYVAPEALDADPDPRQDLYAAGIVGLRLLTGYPQDQPSGSTGQPAHFPDPAVVRPPEVPEQMWEVLQRCRADDPRNRPADAAVAREQWRTAVAASTLEEFDPADPDAVEVFEHLPPPPPPATAPRSALSQSQAQLIAALSIAAVGALLLAVSVIAWITR